jgi:hypothetical protein
VLTFWPEFVKRLMGSCSEWGTFLDCVCVRTLVCTIRMRVIGVTWSCGIILCLLVTSSYSSNLPAGNLFCHSDVTGNQRKMVCYHNFEQ